MLTMVDHERYSNERLREVVRRANEVADEMHSFDRPEAYLKHICDTSDCIYGVWQEPGAPYNVRIALVKGEAAIMEGADRPDHPGLTAYHVRFTDRSQAEIAWMMHGDGREVVIRAARETSAGTA
ncbi:hypothetical protein MKK88_21590 [Methylobacterium sp. E-005]|uniref:hypothetical protein n=1 Tax=Methylobacterium sp. E-005 TaxID=2836549 RepID=UPI001FB93504|nr:hypothetical protein [Methylobacterium sp. E-005]MCJ2088551.1 hypothetical protein [Methylobacterium sp. E-005]